LSCGHATDSLPWQAILLHARHLDADPLRVASERIGSTIAAALGEASDHKSGTVVKLRR